MAHSSHSVPTASAASVKRLRGAAGLTQQQLADGVGVARQTIGRIERGTVTPRYLTLAALARALQVEVEDLTGGDAQ